MEFLHAVGVLTTCLVRLQQTFEQVVNRFAVVGLTVAGTKLLTVLDELLASLIVLDEDILKLHEAEEGAIHSIH